MTYNKGEIVKGTVSGVEPYGIFVKFDDDYSGLIHISEISNKFVKNTNHYAEVGETIYTEIMDVDDKKQQLKLSIKNIRYKVGKYNKRVEIKETETGFTNLKKKLPMWINENIENHKKELNSIDK